MARDVLAAHEAWAASSGAAHITFRQLARLLKRAGHRHFYSNGAVYGDLTILTEGAAIVMDAARHKAERLVALDLIERVDRAMTEMADLRARLARLVP